MSYDCLRTWKRTVPAGRAGLVRVALNCSVRGDVFLRFRKRKTRCTCAKWALVVLLFVAAVCWWNPVGVAAEPAEANVQAPANVEPAPEKTEPKADDPAQKTPEAATATEAKAEPAQANAQASAAPATVKPAPEKAEPKADDSAPKAPEAATATEAKTEPATQAEAAAVASSASDTKGEGESAGKTPAASSQVRVSFNFRFQPWEDVLEWFAQQAGYSLVMDAAPPGTFNYSDSRNYTPSEAIDLLNSILLTKGYTLVLRDRMLMLVNLEDGIPPNLVDTVPVEELGKRGEYELVSCLFHLNNLTAEEAQQEVEKLLGPQGSVVVLPKARQILVTETAGRLRTIEGVIKQADGSAEDSGDEKVQWFELHSTPPEEAMMIVRQLFNIPPDQNASSDGSIRFALDPLGSRLLVSGSAKKLDEISKVLQIIDQPGPEGFDEGSAKVPLQLEVYDVSPADPEASLKVLQTLLVGRPGVRLSTDPKTGNLIALARPEEHATIRATIEQMKQDAGRMEVFRLRVLDPQLAVLAIAKLFANEGTKAPSVDADPGTRQLFARGSQAQIDQIRSLLEKMGEPGGGAATAAGSGNVRMVPFSGQGMEAALHRMEQIWPALHSNPIRRVSPSQSPGMPPTEDGIIDERTLSPETAAPKQPGAAPSKTPTTGKATGDDGKVVPAGQGAPPAKGPETTRWNRSGSPRFRLASDGAAGAADAGDKIEAAAKPSGGAAPIVVAPGPGGVMIASDDAQALDDFERLLSALAGGPEAGAKVTVFYLKYGKAQVVADTLSRILAGAVPQVVTAPSAAPATSAGASSAAPGGVMGYVLGPGGTGGLKLTGSVQVTPDPRLNALFVQAAPADVAVMEQLLKVLDQREGPEEILAQPKPRLVPVYNTQATEIVDILKQVYQDRMAGGGSGASGGRGFNPMEFFQMMRGRGRDSQQGSSSRGGTTEQVDRMSLGVDTRTNSVIVCATDPLFQEVKQLVEELDDAATQSNETVGVVSLHGASPQVVQEALDTLMGSSAQVGSTSSAAGATGTASSRTGQRSSSAGAASDLERMQRRMEALRGLRSGGTRGNSNRGASGRSSRAGAPR